MIGNEARLYSEFGKRLSRIRRSRNLRQADVGEVLGLTRAAISSIETGKQAVTIYQLLSLSHLLDTTPLDLVPELREQRPVAQVSPREAGLSLEQADWISRLLDQIEEAD